MDQYDSEYENFEIYYDHQDTGEVPTVEQHLCYECGCFPVDSPGDYCISCDAMAK